MMMRPASPRSTSDVKVEAMASVVVSARGAQGRVSA
jgi:hypothetical protein